MRKHHHRKKRPRKKKQKIHPKLVVIIISIVMIVVGMMMQNYTWTQTEITTQSVAIAFLGPALAIVGFLILFSMVFMYLIRRTKL